MSYSPRFFAYGTLQLPEVMRAVTGADFPGETAVLPGYARYRLKQLPYPGLCAEAGAETQGILFTGLDRSVLARLDAFEDDFYHRETLVVLTATGEEVEAEVYVIPPRYYARLEPRPWDLEEFRRNDLRAFLSRFENAGD